MKNYEEELPENYKLVKTIDAKKAKVGIVLNLIAVGVVAACLVGAYFIIGMPLSELFNEKNRSLSGAYSYLVFFVALVVYVILHELVHGAAYKIFTKKKLTFGLTLTVAFCGVPEIYTYRRTALIAILAPFILFLPVFLTLCFVLPCAFDKVLAAIMLGLHIGGCSGDLWCAGLLIFKYRGKTTLMNDTGPMQTFYIEDTEK